MKIRLIILLAYICILQTEITDCTCPRGGYRNEQPQFGPRCMYKCNCKNNSEQCEEVSGQCTNGCADGWMGPGCQYGDVAFRKPANQSSSGDPQMNENPSLVVDGNYSTCSNVTNGTMGMWWEVNLGKNYTITGLVITLHETYYNQPFQVEVKNSSVSSGRYCNSNGGFNPTSREIQISCTEDIYGSIVRISSLGSLTWGMLCDLRIFGGRTLAYRRHSNQSSTRYATGDKTDGWAELGVDGGTSSNFTDGSCTHTNATTDYVSPWWRVDLGHEFLINQIHIVNRLGQEGRLSGFKVNFSVKSIETTVYEAPVRDPGLYINVADLLSPLGDSISVELSGGTNVNPRVINVCEVFVFGDCLVNQCGWECEKSCYCKSAIVGWDKIEGICPDEDCLGNWTGTNRRCDYKKTTQEGTEKGVVIGVSIGTVLTLCLVIVIVVFLVNRKRRENILKSKMKEKSIQQSEESNSVVYANIVGSHEKQTTVNRAQEYANIIHTNGNYDANSGRKQGNKYGVATDHKNNQMTQASSPEKDVYYNGVGVNKSRIPLTNLPDYIRSKAYDLNDLESEFEKLPKNPQSSMTIAQMPVNAKKNRYKGLYAYDTTRVVLTPTADISGSDYINACFVKGFKKDRAYIASQGPTDAIVDDFWRMIWHCKVDKIVMLTELVEQGKMKCTKYWPSEGKYTYGPTEVEHLTEDVFADYTIRRFKIHQAGEKCRIVTKFHFTAWPDRGVPETPSSLVQLWSKVRNTEGKPDMPLLVHCSAGVGRTGTFIALD